MMYHVTMSDRKMRHIPANSAADAMSTALHRYRGLVIISCFTGNVDMSLNEAGRTTFEIPPHKALPPDEKEE